MNRDETLALLRMRSALTSQPYSDDVAAAWLEALDEWTYDECRRALVRAAREDKRVTVAHLVERLPQRTRPSGPPTVDELEPGCTGDELVCVLHRDRAARWLAIIRADQAARAANRGDVADAGDRYLEAVAPELWP